MDSFVDTQIKKSANTEREGSPRQGFVPGDIEILQVVLQHRFLRCEQVSELLGHHAKRLHRRLFKLRARGYLRTTRFPQQKHIYGLGRAALPVLVEEGTADPKLLSERSRIHEFKELFLKHEMLIVDIPRLAPQCRAAC